MYFPIRNQPQIIQGRFRLNQDKATKPKTEPA